MQEELTGPRLRHLCMVEVKYENTEVQRCKKNTKTRKYENTRLVVGRSQLGRQCGTSAVPRQLVPSPDSPGRHNPKVDLFDFVQIETQLQKAKCVKIQIQESLLSKPPSPIHLPTQKLIFFKIPRLPFIWLPWVSFCRTGKMSKKCPIFLKLYCDQTD